MIDDSKSIAELAAMKARGEITTEQFEEAKRLLLRPSAATTAPHPHVPAAPKKSGCRTILVWLVIVFGGLIALGSFLESQKTPEEQAQDAANRQAARAKADAEAAEKAARESKERAEERRKGFHCLSAWDGSHAALVDVVTKSLRDPDSFEHDETRITPVDAKGEHSVIMTFRAKNGFGGTNLESAVGTVRQSDCSLASWTMN